MCNVHTYRGMNVLLYFVVLAVYHLTLFYFKALMLKQYRNRVEGAG